MARGDGRAASILRASGLKLTVVKDLGAVYYGTCCAAKDTPGQVFCSTSSCAVVST